MHRQQIDAFFIINHIKSYIFQKFHYKNVAQ